MIFELLAWVALALAALPAVLTLLNLTLYRAPQTLDQKLPAAAVLIPARNEEPRIGRAVDAALASHGVDVEVVVMDDHSTDRTAQIVREIAARDSRVRLAFAPELPTGWAGKQHACQALADLATAPVLVFVDADVELAPDGIAKAVGALKRSPADLVSGFPRQITGSLFERLVIPLIHFVLLGYLPLIGMRVSKSEAFAAGCGQLMVVDRDAYRKAGGHAAIRATFHDGLELPRAFRKAGLVTDLFDATAAASCRMYRGAREVVLGLAKNAHEGMGGPLAIWIWSLLLLGGHLVPVVLLAVTAWIAPEGTALRIALAATLTGIATRLVLAIRFRQSPIGAILHPLGVALLVAIQWYALARRRRGVGVGWKDRVQIES